MMRSSSPTRRAWSRFCQHKLGLISLVLFVAMFVVSLLAEVISNDKPLLVRYQGQWHVPILHNPPETVFGGDFATPTDYLDPYIRQQLSQPGHWAWFPLNPYHHTTLNYFAKEPNPADRKSTRLNSSH